MKALRRAFKLKYLFWLVILLPQIIYIFIGWYIGFTYGRKPIIFGPYPDIPMEITTSLFGQSLEKICGAKALVMVIPQRLYNKPEPDTTYFKITGYFAVPDPWHFEYPPTYTAGSQPGKTKVFLMTGDYSRALAHELKNPEKSLGSISVEELYDFLKTTCKYKDMEKLRSYLSLARFEAKYPWLYSETTLISKAMGNVFTDEGLAYDVLGLVGIVVLFIALLTNRFWMWIYYLTWVITYWFGRIGYHDINLAFSYDGWKVIGWSFWNGFIVKEGRLFLVVAFGLSVLIFGLLEIINLIKKARVSFKKYE